MMSRSIFAAAPLSLCSMIAFSACHQVSAQTPSVTSKPTLTTLHRFDDTHGSIPTDPLTLGSDGSFYGTTLYGGLDVRIGDGEGDFGDPGNGTVFRITPAGQFQTLTRFRKRSDGYSPAGALVEGADGAFYGENSQGGTDGSGSIFRVSPLGGVSIVHMFVNIPDGAEPGGGLTLSGGMFYGTASSGGTYGRGSVFRISASGAFHVIHMFTDGADGGIPGSGVTLGPDGALYGATQRGSFFRISAAGAFSVVRPADGSGSIPSGHLTLGPDGDLYGMTGGTYGTVYKITTVGKVTTLHRFSRDGHGINPSGPLTLGADGDFYATTVQTGTPTPGPNDLGTVFQVTPAGQVTTLYKFHTAFDGQYPAGGVVFGDPGTLYGTTSSGGKTGLGTVFKLTLPQ